MSCVPCDVSHVANHITPSLQNQERFFTTIFLGDVVVNRVPKLDLIKKEKDKGEKINFHKFKKKR